MRISSVKLNELEKIINEKTDVKTIRFITSTNADAEIDREDEILIIMQLTDTKNVDTV